MYSVKFINKTKLCEKLGYLLLMERGRTASVAFIISVFPEILPMQPVSTLRKFLRLCLWFLHFSIGILCFSKLT
jgi:hypothetical protein